MGRKNGQVFSAEFKTRIVLELNLATFVAGTFKLIFLGLHS